MNAASRSAAGFALIVVLGLVSAGCGPATRSASTARVSGTAVPSPSAEGYPVEAVTTPSPAPDLLGGPTSGATYVPVLMYHWIRVNPNPRDQAGFILSVTPTNFATQMLYLSSHGYHVVSLPLAVEAIRTHRALPAHPVVLTFDDGYRDFYTTAAPVLERLGFTATDFVITSFTNRRQFMDWSMIEALDKRGFTIGDHTVDHAALSAIPAAQAMWEMGQAKQDLEAHLGHPVLDLAYPSGEFNHSVVQQAQQLGFECAVTTQFGPLHTPDTLLTMSRMRVSGGISMAYFVTLVGGSTPPSSWTKWAQSQVGALLAPLPQLRSWDL